MYYFGGCFFLGTPSISFLATPLMCIVCGFVFFLFLLSIYINHILLPLISQSKALWQG